MQNFDVSQNQMNQWICHRSMGVVRLGCLDPGWRLTQDFDCLQRSSYVLLLLLLLSLAGSEGEISLKECPDGLLLS